MAHRKPGVILITGGPTKGVQDNLDMLGYELELVARDAHGERITLQLGG